MIGGRLMTALNAVRSLACNTRKVDTKRQFVMVAGTSLGIGYALVLDGANQLYDSVAGRRIYAWLAIAGRG
jgi:hypothetical protein